MKKVSFVLLGLLCVPLPSHADLQKGSQSLSLFGGGIGPDGLFAGGQYIYYLGGSPIVGVGLDVSRLTDYYNSDSHTSVAFAVVKLAKPNGQWRPFLVSGFGAHRSHVRIDGGPWAPPYSWADTGTSELRTVADGSDTSWAALLGVGIDAYLSERFFIGTELRNTFLGSTNIPTNANGAQTYGSYLSTYTVYRLDLLLRVGIKWGKS